MQPQTPDPDPELAITDDMLAARRAMARDAMLGAIQALGQSDLTLLQFGLLLLLEDGRARSVGVLAGHVGRSLSGTSRLVDQLVRRGLLDRQEDPEDRRARRVSLSQDGRDFLVALMRRRAAAEIGLLSRLSAAERQTVTRAMALLARAASEGESHDG